jgi:hypothetical protein
MARRHDVTVIRRGGWKLTDRLDANDPTQYVIAKLGGEWVWLPAPLPDTPAYRFLLARLRPMSMPLGQALIELLRSDVPLDAVWREVIARRLETFYAPVTDQQAKSLGKAGRRRVFQLAKKQLKERGVPAPEAESRVAALLGKSVEALKQESKRLNRIRRTKAQSK